MKPGRYARLYGSFHSHPKTWLVGLAANGLYARCLSYAADHLTDGTLPEDWVMAQVGATKDSPDVLHVVDALIEAGQLERVAGGFRVRDYLEHNPSRQQIRDNHEKDAARKAEEREKDKSKTCPPGRPLDVQTQSSRKTETKTKGVPKEDSESKRASVDQDRLPNVMDDTLKERSVAVLAAVRRIHGERGGNVPRLRGVGLVVSQFPDRDHTQVAGELEYWALEGNGRNRPVKDWVRQYRAFLERAVPGAPSKAGKVRDTADHRDGMARDREWLDQHVPDLPWQRAINILAGLRTQAWRRGEDRDSVTAGAVREKYEKDYGTEAA